MKFRYVGLIGLIAAGAFVVWAQATASSRGPATMATSTKAGTTPGCCGVQMKISGDIHVYTPPDGRGTGGVLVPAALRAEVYGSELVATVELAAGSYVVEVEGSENFIAASGKRVFSVTAFSGGTAAGAGTKTELGKNIDLYTLAGGLARPFIVKGTVKHAGGTLRIVMSSSVDNAKFSAIRIFDAQGAKAAWLFADDVAAMARLSDTPPKFDGPALWRDAAQPFEKRAADLVKRMTLKEKIAQLQNSAPAINRLELPFYNYWSEGLHGVVRNGYATVFPQAIGMSASFDPDLLHAVADTISTEARAKYNGWQAAGGRDDLYGGWYKGLTFWSPNINLFRDPRWGRGQETYGEDPYLTGTMGVAFVKGMQGDDPRYLKTAATAKHFAVHSGPEDERHTFNAVPPMRDFYESYLPQFEALVREGKVASVMGAYNRVYGSPANASDLLLKDILRRQWGFAGYVVSDCGAVYDIWARHQTETDRPSASAVAILAGCDLECGSQYASLAAAVDVNLVGEAAIDQALTRVLLSRFKLGLFDPPSQVKYTSIKSTENASAAHDAQALQMARESIVLLKNDGVLPLSKSTKKIAIVGPNAVGYLPLLGNYNGTAIAPIDVMQGITGTFKGDIIHVRGCDNAPRTGPWQLIPDVCLHPSGTTNPDETGLKAEHFDNIDLFGRPITTRTEKTVDFWNLIEWQLGGIPISRSSSRWSGQFVAPADGDYHLTATGNISFRFYVAGKMVADHWTVADGGDRTLTSPDQVALSLKAGQSVPLVLECRQNTGTMDLQLLWNRGDLDVTAQVAARVKDADAILFFGGLDAHMEAEEGDIRGKFERFRNGDRDSIELPATQTATLKALAATGKPVVFVNMTGSAVAMPWEAAHLNAIVQAWYPGQSGGRAVADVLFGDYNPSGRLPITFYKATADLPAFGDYAMKERTYRYATREPQWPFGFGLTYSDFRYSTFSISAKRNEPVGAEDVAANGTLYTGISLINGGPRDGEEVVQVYARMLNPRQPGDSLQQLVAFKRVRVSAGATVNVDFTIPVSRLRVWDPDSKSYVVRPGRYELFISPGSAGQRNSTQFSIK